MATKGCEKKCQDQGNNHKARFGINARTAISVSLSGVLSLRDLSPGARTAISL